MTDQPKVGDKPLAGNCLHHWQDQKGPYVAQICQLCKLYRYKAAPTADWEYRAPIPIVRGGSESGHGPSRG